MRDAVEFVAGLRERRFCEALAGKGGGATSVMLMAPTPTEPRRERLPLRGRGRLDGHARDSSAGFIPSQGSTVPWTRRRTFAMSPTTLSALLCSRAPSADRSSARWGPLDSASALEVRAMSRHDFAPDEGVLSAALAAARSSLNRLRSCLASALRRRRSALAFSWRAISTCSHCCRKKSVPSVRGRSVERELGRVGVSGCAYLGCCALWWPTPTDTPPQARQSHHPLFQMAGGSVVGLGPDAECPFAKTGPAAQAVEVPLPGPLGLTASMAGCVETTRIQHPRSWQNG